MNTFSRYFTNKGQSIVEFAFVLAFCVGLAFVMDIFGFKGILNEAFGETVFKEVVKIDTVEVDPNAQISDTFGQAHESSFTAETQLKRLKADQDVLTKIGGFFLGLNKTAVQKALNIKDSNVNGWLGAANADKSMDGLLITRFDENTDPSIPGLTSYEKLKPNESAAANDKDKTGGRVFNWINGDYGTLDETTNIISYDHDYIVNHTQGTSNVYRYYTDSRVFVSDYTVFNDKSVVGENAASTGIKIQLWYKVETNVRTVTDNAGNPVINPETGEPKTVTEYTQTVRKVKINIDPASNSKTNPYNSHTDSKGLRVELEIERDSDGNFIQNPDGSFKVKVTPQSV